MKNNSSKFQVLHLALAALFSALAYVSVLFINVPLMPEFAFLKFDPKDIFIILGSLILSPLYSLLMALVVPLLQFITSGRSGIIGFIMNLLSTVALVLPVSMLYRKKKDFKQLAFALFVAILFMTGIMLLWNYVFTPIFMPELKRATIGTMLLFAILPFNLLKGFIDAVVIVMLYLFLWPLLQKRGILQAADYTENSSSFKERYKLEIGVFAVIFILSVILLTLAFFNII